MKNIQSLLLDNHRAKELFKKLINNSFLIYLNLKYFFKTFFFKIQINAYNQFHSQEPIMKMKNRNLSIVYHPKVHVHTNRVFLNLDHRN